MSDDFPIETRFALEARIGRGGSGDVHRATDRETGRTVAVKRLLAVHDDPQLIDRFRREARLLSQIDDPHVVQYVAHGVDRSGRPSLVVEWLDGEDLSRRQKRQRLSIAEALDVGRQCAVGLHALHRAGIVHRDIKPANIYLVAGDDAAIHVKLIDLGIARAVGEATLTTVGNMLGTPFYMAPEQARGEERVTSRADQFSLGAVLFELLSARRAFTGEDVFAILAKIVLSDPPRLRDVIAGVPPAMDALVRRAMSKLPEDRFGSARELADAIAAVPPWTPLTGPAAVVAAPIDDELTTRVAAISSTSERRVVTAVFAGFPPAPNDQDLRLFEEVAAEHGATTHPTLGRRVIAVFGGARTTGDEVVRAARAARAAIDRVPGIRLAIATGRALAGVTGLTGELIDRGVRVVEREPPRSPGVWPVRVDDASARLLTEHFVIEGPPGARVLGEVRPAITPPRTLVGKPTPCVGRDRELASLDATFAECVSEPVARAVVVTGPAGIGKSRVRYELLARLARSEAEPAVLLARGSPLAEGSAFGLLAPALRRFAGIFDGEPAAEQRHKLAQRIGRHAPAHVVDRIAEIALVPDANTLQGRDRLRLDAMLTGDRMRAAWIEWLDAESSAHPMVIVLEDLQWGDLATVSFLDAALRALEHRPILVVALARPEVHERFPALWSGRGVQEIRLGPLTPKAAERLVRAALGDGVDPAMVQRIVGRGEGNAFYVEELIRAVSEGAGEALPDSVLGMVQARLDALGPETKKVLRAASLFGQVFWRGGVAALIGEQASALDGPLERLVAAEVISRRTSAAFPGEEELVFRHALVREAAYAMIPDPDRRAGHRQAGAWLERAGEVDPVLLATHFERGEDLERAASFYLRAALVALTGNDFASAIAHAERSATLGATTADGTVDAPRRRGRARLIQAEALRWRGEMGPAAAAAAEAAELLPRGSPTWFHAVRESIAASGRLGQFERVAAWADAAIACEAAAEAAGARIACLVPAAAHLFYAGRTDAAAHLLAQIEAIEATAGDVDPSVTARLYQLRALHADHGGYLEDALAHHRSALASFERAGDRRGACLTLSNLGFVLAGLGAFPEAEDALRRAHAGAERMGLGTIVPLALHNLGGVLAALGRLDEAREIEQRAVVAFAAAGDPRLEGASRVYLSRILLAAGHAAEAEAEARLVAEGPSSPAPLRAGALAALALALLASGRADEALAAANAAAAALEALGAVEDFEVLIGIALAEARDACDDADGARLAIAAARERLLGRASRLSEPTRKRFLEAVPDNARCLGLALVWAVADGASETAFRETLASLSCEADPS